MKKYVYVLLFLVVCGFSNYYVRYFKFFKTLASCIVYPILRINAYGLDSLKKISQKRKTREHLQHYIEHLEQERNQWQEKAIALHTQLGYVQDTYELHQFAQRYESSKKCIAQVIAKIFSDQAHYFFVDAGSSKGVELDMVAVFKNCLVGRVVEVYPWYSKVVLVTDRSCKVAAVCLQTEVQGIYEGTHALAQAHLSFVSKLDSLLLDDMVISSGDGLIFPRGFCLGTIIECSPAELHYSIYVKPLLDFSSISYCYLIKKT